MPAAKQHTTLCPPSSSAAEYPKMEGVVAFQKKEGEPRPYSFPFPSSSKPKLEKRTRQKVEMERESGAAGFRINPQLLESRRLRRMTRRIAMRSTTPPRQVLREQDKQTGLELMHHKVEYCDGGAYSSDHSVSCHRSDVFRSFRLPDACSECLLSITRLPLQQHMSLTSRCAATLRLKMCSCQTTECTAQSVQGT